MAEVFKRLEVPEALEILPECSVRFYFSMHMTFYKFVSLIF